MAPRQPTAKGLTLLTLLCSSSLPSYTRATRHEFQRHASHPLHKRDAPDLNFATYEDASDSVAGQTFDYVIVGGGTAALVVATRLAEDTNTTVAVIEAGSSGAEVASRIAAPATAFFNGLVGPGSPYNWGYSTTNQTGLNGRTVSWPRGKLLAGSSAINGAYLTRGSKIEHDAWSELQGAGDDTWSWENILPYYKKHETYEAPSQEYSDACGGIVSDLSVHGGPNGASGGPIHYSHAGYLYEQIHPWIPTWAALGVGTRDPAAGNVEGAQISTSAIRQSDQTRTSARNYLDNKPSNLIILTNSQVTKINFDRNAGSIAATGVNYQSGPEGQSQTMTARREVILAGGVIGSPHVLQLSGVGPADVLQAAGIELVLDLPGVGAHLQDHLSSSFSFDTTASITGDLIQTDPAFNASQWDLWVSGRGTESLYSAPNEAIAYLNITTLLGEDGARAYMDKVKAALPDMMSHYGHTGTVAKGFETAYKLELESVLGGGDPAVEFLLANNGKGAQLQFALQHPFSRGSLKVTSADPFTSPAIDPGYLTHPNDIEIITAAMKYIRNVAKTAPLSDIIGAENYPANEAPSEDEAALVNFALQGLSTEYHPSASMSMLPLELGGVVDTQLRVHGIDRLRVIDSSVIPIGMAAHLMSPTFAVAEKGAAIILGQDPSVAGSGNSSTNATSTSSETTPARASGTASMNTDSASSSTGTSAASRSVNLVSYLVATGFLVTYVLLF